MIDYLQSQLTSLYQTASGTYGVNPFVFLILYLGSAPFFYVSIYKTIKAIATRKTARVPVWIAVLLCAASAPFVYVIFFGRNIPIWVYIVLAVLVGQSVYTLARKIRQGPKAKE